nr:uncharacterized protein LOC105845170 [Hydra vulgaris]
MYNFSITAKCFSILILCFQGLMLNNYLSLIHNNLTWWVWCISDVLVISIWMFVLFYMHKKYKAIIYNVNYKHHSMSYNEIKYIFIMWFSYVFVLCPRIIIIFIKDVHTLNEKKLFGPNFLKISLACTPLIFLFMIFGYHGAEINSKRQLYISSISSSVALDLFDSMDLLELLFDPRSVPHHILIATLIFACINFTLPTLAFYDLHVKQFKGRVTGFSFKMFYSCVIIFLVNLPNLILRIVLWFSHRSEISVLIMKNVMYIVLAINTIIEHYFMEPPKKCLNCKNFYEEPFFNEHCLGCCIKNDNLKL